MIRRQNLKERIKTKFGIFVIKKGSNLMAKGLNIATQPVRFTTKTVRQMVGETRFREGSRERVMVERDVKVDVINKGTKEEGNFLFVTSIILSQAKRDYYKWLSDNPRYKFNSTDNFIGHISTIASAEPILEPVIKTIWSEKEVITAIDKIKELNFKEDLKSITTKYEVEVPKSKSYEKNSIFEFEIDSGTKIKIEINNKHNDETKSDITQMSLCLNGAKLLPKLIPSDVASFIKKT